MKKLLFTLLLSSFSHADTLGGEISLGLFYHTIEGSVDYQSFSTSNVAEALGFSDTQDVFFSASLELPIPLIPNIKLSHTTLSHSGNTGGILQNNSLSVEYTDTTLYYEVLDTWLELDVGATYRYIKTEMNIPIALQSNTISNTHSIPLLYAKGRFSIPTTDLSVQLETNALSFSDVRSYDYALSTRYTFAMGLGIEAGYKSFHIDGDVLLIGLQSDLDFSGIYTAVSWDF